MSELKLISPLLDDFIMGDPISDHNGIRCCPAMNNTTGNKYIVKIISFPASQNQYDALKLTGALTSEEDAKAYFENRAKETVRELESLQLLSTQEGFLPTEGYQVVPADDGVGVDIYILTSYRRTLERQFIKKPLTQLNALNLGLDICSALAACRRSGFLFVNLKPSNIYVTENGEYKISDLGLISLAGLKYATLPANYVSQYTAPEVKDPFASINTSIDVYALGMLLYQIFNGGQLPTDGSDPLPAPQYADEELSAIILKACSSSIEDRWEDPAQMGQALVSFIQKNGALDVPIVPPAPEPVIITEPTEEPAQEETVNEEESTEAQQIYEVQPAPEDADSLQTDDATEPEPAVAEQEEAPEDEDVASITGETIEPDVQPEPAAEDEDPQLRIKLELPEESSEASQAPAEDETSDADSAEGVPVIDPENVTYSDLTPEVSDMLSQADELAAMEVPEPVVAPEPIEVELPVPEEEPDNAVAAPVDDTQLPIDDDGYISNDVNNEADDDDDEDSAYAPVVRPRWIKAAIAGIIALLIAILLFLGGFLFYKYYVEQTIDTLSFDGYKDVLTVYVETDVSSDQLSVSCVEKTNDQNFEVPVVDGKAVFSGLSPSSTYDIKVNIDGLHILVGDTEGTYFTDARTQITQHSVVTGSTAGTAILSFSVNGPTPEQWSFTYSTPGQASNTVVFTGNSVTLENLAQDMIYTGTLIPAEDLYFTEETEISFTASGVIQANDLTITSLTDGILRAQWTAPEGTQVRSWNVRCYNDSDFDKTITTSDCFVAFENLDDRDSYTVEVKAEGQSLYQIASVGKNSITVTDITVDCSQTGIIILNWECENAPQDGWILSYTLNGSETLMNIPCQGNSAIIEGAVPAMEYDFTIRAADSTPTVHLPAGCETAEAENFYVNYGGLPIYQSNLRFYMCRTPSNSGWDHSQIDSADYTTTFRVGEKASFVVFMNRTYGKSADKITTTFVVEDEAGQVVCLSTYAEAWTYMWYKNYCELDIPAIPDAPGRYNVSIYFNGMFAGNQAFSVVE